MNEYITRLKSHDWFWFYTDDHSVYKRWEVRSAELQALQRQHDPDMTIWRSYERH